MKIIQFLNDDLVLWSNFLESQYQTLLQSDNVGAVGCKIIKSDHELLEAGSTVFNNGACAGYGRLKHPNDYEYRFVRPVHYISGACLMIRKKLFDQYPFNEKLFPAYYEDTDLQMNLKHNLKQRILYNPDAVVYHLEHGTFQQAKAEQLMIESSKVFHNRWEKQLKDATSHINLEDSALKWRYDNQQELRILVIDDFIPRTEIGCGYIRAYCNYCVLSGISSQITIYGTEDHTVQTKDVSILNLQRSGIELVLSHPAESNWDKCEELKGFLSQSSRQGYDLLFVSRSSVMVKCQGYVRDYCIKNNCKIIYDSESSFYRRHELLIDASKKHYISQYTYVNIPVKYVGEIQLYKELELNATEFVDAFVVVADYEKKITEQNIASMKKSKPVHVIGHMLPFTSPTVTSFQQREGLLITGGYNGYMYYNGDATWWFLHYCWKAILQRLPHIRLKLVGYKIPQEIYELVRQENHQNIDFFDQVETVWPYYESSRLAVLPHQYGAGIQWKISEYLAAGLPSVLTDKAALPYTQEERDSLFFTANQGTHQEFIEKIVLAYTNEKLWTERREAGLKWVHRTHDRNLVAKDIFNTVQSTFPQRKLTLNQEKMNRCIDKRNALATKSYHSAILNPATIINPTNLHPVIYDPSNAIAKVLNNIPMPEEFRASLQIIKHLNIDVYQGNYTGRPLIATMKFVGLKPCVQWSETIPQDRLDLVKPAVFNRDKKNKQLINIHQDILIPSHTYRTGQKACDASLQSLQYALTYGQMILITKFADCNRILLEDYFKSLSSTFIITNSNEHEKKNNDLNTIKTCIRDAQGELNSLYMIWPMAMAYDRYLNQLRYHLTTKTSS